MKKKKTIIAIAISLILLVLCILLFALAGKDKDTVNTVKKTFTLVGSEVSFTNYDKISYGKYYLLYDGANTSIVNSLGKTIEKYSSDTLSMIKYFNSESYSDYYYILGNEFILKKDGVELATIKYDTLDFDLRKSSSTIEILNDEYLILKFNAKESIPDKTDSTKKVTVNMYYAYIYNFKTKALYPKIVSYGNITKFNNSGEDIYLLLTNKDNNYELYSVKNNNVVFNNYYPKVGDLNTETNISSSKSSKYIYVCSKLNAGIYNSCGLIDYEGKSILTLKYDDNSIIDYNDDYYVIKKDLFMGVYDYINVSILNGYDYILLSSKYVITFKDGIIDIYDKDLEKLKSFSTDLNEIITKDSDEKSKNVELIDEEDTIILNIYDNNSIDSDKVENSDKTKSYIYSADFKDIIEGRRLYPVYNSNNELSMFYSPEYSGKSILKIYLYSVKLEAFRIINLNSNSGNFEILNKCDDLSIGYLLDGNYTIYNPKFDSPGTLYISEGDYNNAICNSVGDYTIANTSLFDSNNQKIAFNQIKAFNKLEDSTYFIIHDNKLGIFK